VTDRVEDDDQEVRGDRDLDGVDAERSPAINTYETDSMSCFGLVSKRHHMLLRSAERTAPTISFFEALGWSRLAMQPLKTENTYAIQLLSQKIGSTKL
jgi:hypothetical protein